MYKVSEGVFKRKNNGRVVIAKNTAKEQEMKTLHLPDDNTNYVEINKLVTIVVTVTVLLHLEMYNINRHELSRHAQHMYLQSSNNAQ